MLTKFWEAAGGKLAERWLAVSVPALLFWFGGGLAWVYDSGGWSSVATRVDWVTKQSALIQGVLLIAVLLVFGVTALVVARLTEPTLHVVEGYWPSWALRSWRQVAGRFGSRVETRDQRWQQLHKRLDDADPTLRPEDFAEFLRLDRAQRRHPSMPYRRMPTRVGTILRAAESWPFDKYGLETIAVWPRLWLLLPETTRTELVAARQAMTGAVAAGMWGLLFIGFGVLTLWAVPVGLLVAGLALRGWLPGRAQTFGDLIEATFDVHRTLLYQHLRWPLPQNPSAERATGLALTTYLWRGSDATEPTFAATPEPAEPVRKASHE